MSKLQKLIVLIIMSLSVYIIYLTTNNSQYKILIIGDTHTINNESQKESNYIDYYKKQLQKNQKNIVIDSNYVNKTQNINNMLETIRNTPEIKSKLLNSDQVIINLGYNDLLFNMALTNQINNNEINKIISNIEADYNNLIKEIKKYNHKQIIMIGYYSNNDNNYLDYGIKELNKVIENNKAIQYIDTYYLLNNKNKFFSNNNQYPNNYGNYLISKKIISKTLENL